MGYKISANSPLKRDKGARFLFPKVFRTKKAAEDHADSINKKRPEARARTLKTKAMRKTPGQTRIRTG